MFPVPAEEIKDEIIEEQPEQEAQPVESAPRILPLMPMPILVVNPNRSFVRHISSKCNGDIQTLQKKEKLSIAARVLFSNNQVMDELANPELVENREE